jgi:LL-diaminopimelate aminotransferase
MKIQISQRLNRLPPYLFAQIDRAKKAALGSGRDIINLGVGDPDLPTPRHIIEALYDAAKDPANHRYALDQGMDVLRQAIADWYKRRFGVTLNPDTQVLPLIGSKEGIAHIPMAFVNPGDVVLHTEPNYPPYKTATILALGTPYALPMLEKNDFLPDLKSIPKAVLKKAKLLFINYPNNPTAAVAHKRFFKEVVEFARKNKIIVCHDAAYTQIAFDGYRPPSFLEVEGAFGVGVEFHSLSKTYNMTGWRIGWVCGNAEVVAALGQVKTNIDSGIFGAIQIAGVSALKGPQYSIEENNETYRQRRDELVSGLKALRWNVACPKATFYVWARLPKGHNDSRRFCKLLLEKADIVAIPGIGFGKSGEGFIRMALTVSKDRIKEAVNRIAKIL